MKQQSKAPSMQIASVKETQASRSPSWKRMAILAISLAMAFTCSIAVSGCGSAGKGGDVLSLTLATNKDMGSFIDAMKAEFPGIKFEIYQYKGKDGSGFLRQTILNDDASDIVFSTQRLTDEEALTHLLDLSGYRFTTNMNPTLLHQFDIDGRIYQVPGPVSIRCMAYNKTLFEEHGWRVPSTHEELLETIRQIRADEPDMTPIAMSLAAPGYPFTTVTTLSQAGSLSTPSGAQWLNRYNAGRASIKEGWAEGLEMTADLIDAGAFNGCQEYVGKWDGRVIQESFANRQAAMMFVWAGQGALVEMMEGSHDEYALLPFFGHDEGRTLLGISYSTTWGLNSRLADKGNERKRVLASEVLAWIQTPETQELLRDSTTEIPSLRIIDGMDVHLEYKRLWESSGGSYIAPMIYASFADSIVPVGNIVQHHMLSNDSDGMAEKIISTVNRIHRANLADSKSITVYGRLKEDLTAEETVQVVADAIHGMGIGDFALVSIGGGLDKEVNPTGVSGWLYAGDITDANLSTMLPGGTNILEVAHITGSEVKRLLEEGKVIANDDEAGTSFPYYAAGLDLSFKGRNLDGASLNGAELEDDRTYEVVFVQGDYSGDFAQTANLTATELDVTAALKKHLANNYPLTAPALCR